MKWSKPPGELVRSFEEKVAGIDCERRKLFGYPCAFINGNMFFGTFTDGLFLRLGEKGAGDARARHGDIRPFEPRAGRPMREYVVLPERVRLDDSLLDPLLEAALRYVRTLPPKNRK